MTEIHTIRRFLISCLRARWDPAALQAAHSAIAHADIDWDVVQRTAHRERLTPLLYHIVRGQDLVPRAV